MAQPVFDTPIDCASDNQASYAVTIPAKAFMSTVKWVSVGTSATSLVNITLDAVGANYVRNFHVNTSDGVDSQPSIGGTSFSGTVHSGFNTLIGTNLACPTYFEGRFIDIGDTTVQVESGWQTAETAHTSMTLATSAGVMNSGFIYVTHYIRNAEIIDHVDLSDTPAPVHDFATGNNNTIVFMGVGLTMASSTEPKLRIGTDASTFADGATDYRYIALNAGLNSAGTQDHMIGTRLASTSNDFAARLENFNVATAPTVLINGMQMETADTTPTHTTSRRTLAEKNTHLRLFNTAAANFTAGDAWVIGSK